MFRLAGGSIRIGELELALVLGAGLEIEDGSGKTVRHRVIEILPAPINPFTSDTQQRKRLTPCSLAGRAKLDVPEPSKLEGRLLDGIGLSLFDCIAVIRWRRGGLREARRDLD